MTNPSALTDRIRAEDATLRRRVLLLSAIPLVLGVLVIVASVAAARDASTRMAFAQERIDELRRSERDVLEATAAVLSGTDVRFRDSSVKWSEITDAIVKVPSGQRKRALFGAILSAWKQIDFRPAGGNIRTGFDSPRFVLDVLRRAGVRLDTVPGRQVGPAVLRQVSPITANEVMPGDLIVYQFEAKPGEPHTAMLFYLAKGATDGHGIGVGILNTGKPLGITDTRCLELRTCGFAGPFLGYFRPRYDRSDVAFSPAP